MAYSRARNIKRCKVQLSAFDPRQVCKLACIENLVFHCSFNYLNT